MHELPKIMLPRNEELLLADMEEDSDDEIQPMCPQSNPAQSEKVSPKEKFSNTLHRAYIDMPYSVFPWSFLQKSHENNTLEIQEEMAQEVVVQATQPVAEKGTVQATFVPCFEEMHPTFDPLHNLLKPFLDHTVIDENWVFQPP
ncbi:hypothetical protein M5689_020916 [Euphorbia peplus]|nr:hypothetical protein M5689_020916 [Euphorbia peplus]